MTQSFKEEYHRSLLPSLTQEDRTIENLRRSTTTLLSEFVSKLDTLRGNEEISKKIIKQGFSKTKVFGEAIKFFGSDEVRYIAIDGTEFEQNTLDILVFYSGAFGYSGFVRFSDSYGVVADPPQSEEDSFGLSSAIPLSEEFSSEVFGEPTEGGIEVDSGKVPSSLMRLSEYFLAYNCIKKDETIKIVIMDRTISGDIAHISWKLREYIKQGKCFLEGYETSLGKITREDLELGRMLIDNDELKIPSARSHLLKFSAMKAMIDAKEKLGRTLTLSDLVLEIGMKEERKEKLLKDLRETFGRIVKITPRPLFKDTPASSLHLEKKQEDILLEVNSEVKYYWDRLIEAALVATGSIFNPPQDSHPMRINFDSPRRGSWITTDDIDYLSLILIYAILRESWKKNRLLLGIVKDTASNELVKTVIPVLESARLLKLSRELPKFASDKMLLQANSVVNSGVLSTPWRTFEYDVCFRTITPKNDPKLEKGECRVEGAFENVITNERMFVKSYFQLWSSPTDPSVRSHVFLYDRPCYPQYEMSEEGRSELVLKHRDSVEETIFPAIHFASESPISELVLAILYCMGQDPIPEALGHNYPLFLADKKAKSIESEAERACVSAIELEVARSKLDQQILFEDRFRDYRDLIERKRKTKSRKSAGGR